MPLPGWLTSRGDFQKIVREHETSGTAFVRDALLRVGASHRRGVLVRWLRGLRGLGFEGIEEQQLESCADALRLERLEPNKPIREGSDSLYIIVSGTVNAFDKRALRFRLHCITDPVGRVCSIFVEALCIAVWDLI